MWCDASNLAVGVCLEIDGSVVEDASWLRKQQDVMHVNLAELDAVLKGVNLAAEWGVENLEVVADSATVFGWINAVVTQSRKIHTKGLSEMLFRRRLSVLKCTLEERGIAISMRLVKSAENKADKMMRVPTAWCEKTVCMSADSSDVDRWAELKRIHDETHFGVDRTLYIVKQYRPELGVNRSEVKKIVDTCFQCKSIDPAPVCWTKGELSVESNWSRVACDVTHFAAAAYLTMIDCGPSRFAIWKAISNEALPEVSNKLLEVFRERGPPEQLLLDNAAVFKSRRFIDFCERWGVSVNYRAAYRPSGNGIVERHHRTIKRMAARTGRQQQQQQQQQQQTF